MENVIQTPRAEVIRRKRGRIDRRDGLRIELIELRIRQVILACILAGNRGFAGEQCTRRKGGWRGASEERSTETSPAEEGKSSRDRTADMDFGDFVNISLVHGERLSLSAVNIDSD